MSFSIFHQTVKNLVAVLTFIALLIATSLSFPVEVNVAPAGVMKTTNGILGELFAPKSKRSVGKIQVAVANIPNRTGDKDWRRSMRKITKNEPAFVILNEISRHSSDELRYMFPEYRVIRATQPDYSPGGAQAMNNVILAKRRWKPQETGIERVVNDDQGYIQGEKFTWDRFAVWGIFTDNKGATISVVSTHMPTNPEYAPKQHGDPKLTRIELYSKGMRKLAKITDQLQTYGPVIVGGDMNSHPTQIPWAAAPKMAQRGFSYVKDQGVMYLFYKEAYVTDTYQIDIVSDHPALVTTLRYWD